MFIQHEARRLLARCPSIRVDRFDEWKDHCADFLAQAWPLLPPAQKEAILRAGVETPMRTFLWRGAARHHLKTGAVSGGMPSVRRLFASFEDRRFPMLRDELFSLLEQVSEEGRSFVFRWSSVNGYKAILEHLDGLRWDSLVLDWADFARWVSDAGYDESHLNPNDSKCLALYEQFQASKETT